MRGMGLTVVGLNMTVYHSLTKAGGRQSWYQNILHLAVTFDCQQILLSMNNPVSEIVMHSLSILSCLDPRKKEDGGRART